MDLKKLIEDSRTIIRRFKNESPQEDRISLDANDFINLLNDKAEGPILNEPLKINNELHYIHKAVYEGVLITTTTERKISDSGEFGI
jgi:hypothetical protein